MNLLSRVATGTPRVLSAVAAVLLLVFFFLSSGNGFLRRMVEVVPSMTEKKIVVSIARDVQTEMSRYLVMISIINLGIGAATAVTMALLGVPDPLLWGALAGILNFAPYVGPTLTAVGLAFIGFTTFNTRFACQECRLEIPRIIECAVHNLRISRKFLFAVNLLIFPQKSRGIPSRKPLGQHWSCERQVS